MKQQKDVQLVSMPKIQKRTDFLNDLDGLLVNSKNFNKLFVQRTNHEWIKTQVEKLVQSHIHLSKFIEILTNFIVSETHHPHVVQEVLSWLDYCVQHYSASMQTPEIQQSLKKLCSHYQEMCAFMNMFVNAANRGNAMKNWSDAQKLIGYFPRRFYYSILPKTQFAYIDDEDNHAGKSNASPLLHSLRSTKENLDIPNDGKLFDVDSMSSVMKDDSEYEQESLDESDAGVFDVNEPLSSDAEQLSNTRYDDLEEIVLSEAEGDSDEFHYPDIGDSDNNFSVSTEASNTSAKPNTLPDATKELETIGIDCDKEIKIARLTVNESNDSALNISPDNRQRSLRSNSKITRPED
ncbi:hypothetical protein EWB00_008946 [Schistosoma japonicum]|nr:hypothetical protein KSF78_0008907 [Schistosoma japonicum]KAH8858457.1 hypothetical protein KSF78_0008907 [Schistosoma japonicum]KAH8858459.1 hypothetical protein KSF78_0008907 [Schistosoma japonicum]KAH8858462.1 hypothetical protein KSF78_0008907 [Schistosoma japonicum]TNN05791.1 hypothetical protein EWB00_008946 [Schistosoma japonicum]